MSWEVFLFFVVATQGIILSFFFIIPKPRNRKMFLGLYLLMFSITILHYVRFWSGNIVLPAILMWVAIISSWLMPPALYFYYNHPEKWERKHLLHLIAPVLFSIYWILGLFIRYDLYFSGLGGYMVSLVKIVLFLGYGIFIIKKTTFRGVDRMLLLGYGGFIFGLIFYSLAVITDTYSLKIDYIICAAFVILTYGITYYGQRNFLKEKAKKPSYVTSSLTQEDAILLVNKIIKSLKDDKLYKDSDFNLSRLASQLNVPKYRISQALNTYSNRSFSELINEFRINDAKERLKCKTSQHLKLEAIGEEVGFKNKVSFYKNFKKAEGISPGTFRQKYIDQTD